MAVRVPTREWIYETAVNLQRFYRNRNNNILAWRSLYFMDPEAYFIGADGSFIEAEDDEVRVILPVAYSTVEAYRSTLLARPPVIDVPVSELREVHAEQAEAIERMLYAVWDRANVNHALQDALWHALVDGWGVLQVRFDPEAELRGEVPIVVRSLDPIGIFPMPAERPGKWEYVIASYYELAGTLRARFVEGRDGRLRTTRQAKRALEGLAEDDRVQVVEYWDDTYHAIMVVPADRKDEDVFVAEGEWLLPPTEHKYGALPFVIFHGLHLPFRDRGERIGVSVLWPIQELVRYLSKLISQKATIIARYTMPTLVTRTQDGQGVDVGLLGGQINLFPDEDVQYLMPQGPAPQIDVQIEEIVQQIEQAGLPRHMMGQLTVSRLSGVAMNLLRTPVLMRIAFKQMAIEDGLEYLNEVILRMIENRLSEPVYLWGSDPEGQPIEVLLDPSVVNGYYRNRVRLSASLPTDEPATVAMLATLRQLGILSKRTTRDIVQQVLRDLSPQSLEMEEDQIQIEQLLDMPQIQLALALEAASEAGMVDVVQQAQALFGGTPGQRGSAPGFTRMGSESGLSPFNPLNSLAGSRENPRTSDVRRELAARVMDNMGGRPPAPTETPLTPTSPAEVAEE